MLSSSELETMLGMARDSARIHDEWALQRAGRIHGGKVYRSKSGRHRRRRENRERLNSIRKMKVASEIAYGARRMLDSAVVARRYRLIALGSFMVGVATCWMIGVAIFS